METDDSGIYNGGFGGSFHILVKPEHFLWLSKQCEILGTNKEELVANILQEWLPGNSTWAISGLGASVVVEMALSDFISRHGSEFIPVDE